MYLMFFVFLLELIFAFMPLFVGEITKLLSRLIYSVTNEEMNTRAEIKDLKDKQAGISVTDDFASYARIQRKVDKLLLVIKEKGNERKQQITYLRMGITIGIYCLHVIILLTFMIFLRNEPLMLVESSWFAPFGKIVAFPTGIPGSVGLGCWMLVSNTVISRFRTLIGI
ncbi:guided entry of tail-anchored proteins factor 1-like [Physella acuta]|uniref:guided entry of tail-anchored proteins factor 1-like n=1 Tax=Physella acuta TaxID=109671 RepID=UPI0027DC8D9C|nr:guided entry of tail-anchored proteins factor 1-like [Physella acuta]